MMALDSILFLSYHIQPMAGPSCSAARLGSSRNGPLLFTLNLPRWFKPLSFFCLQSQLPSSVLLSTPQLEAASENANLMVSWQLKTFWDFPSRIKSHVLNKKRWQPPQSFLCCFPLSSWFFSCAGLLGLPISAAVFAWNVPPVMSPFLLGFSAHCDLCQPQD